MKSRIIFAALLAFALASPAFASEIHGTVSSGSTQQQQSSGSVSGNVSGGDSGSVSGNVNPENQGSGSVSGTVAGGSTGSVSGTVNGSGGGGGGGGGSPGSISPIYTGASGGGTTFNNPTETITTFGPNIPVPGSGSSLTPSSTGGAALTDGSGDLALATTAPEVFGTNQSAAALNSGLGAWWWAIALGIIALLGIGWWGYSSYYGGYATTDRY